MCVQSVTQLALSYVYLLVLVHTACFGLCVPVGPGTYSLLCLMCTCWSWYIQLALSYVYLLVLVHTACFVLCVPVGPGTYSLLCLMCTCWS